MENQFSRSLQKDIVLLLRLHFVMEKVLPRCLDQRGKWSQIHHLHGKITGLSLTTHRDPEADREKMSLSPHTGMWHLNARSVPGLPVPLNREHTCTGGSQLKIQIASKQSPNNKAEIH